MAGRGPDCARRVARKGLRRERRWDWTCKYLDRFDLYSLGGGGEEGGRDVSVLLLTCNIPPSLVSKVQESGSREIAFRKGRRGWAVAISGFKGELTNIPKPRRSCQKRESFIFYLNIWKLKLKLALCDSHFCEILHQTSFIMFEIVTFKGAVFSSIVPALSLIHISEPTRPY